jgi:hypothetical protein
MLDSPGFSGFYQLTADSRLAYVRVDVPTFDVAGRAGLAAVRILAQGGFKEPGQPAGIPDRDQRLVGLSPGSPLFPCGGLFRRWLQALRMQPLPILSQQVG